MAGPYFIRQDDKLYDRVYDRGKAVSMAELLFHSASEESDTTFSVSCEKRKLVASFTNRSIEGIFYMQEWGGAGKNQLLTVAQESFDATDIVLAMRHEELIALKNNHESSDELGKRFVPWPGPFAVDIEEPIKDYFGVSRLKDITPEALLFAANQRALLRASAKTAPEAQPEEVTVQLRLLVQPGAQVADFLGPLFRSAATATSGGVSILDSRIEGHSNR